MVGDSNAFLTLTVIFQALNIMLEIRITACLCTLPIILDAHKSLISVSLFLQDSSNVTALDITKIPQFTSVLDYVQT